MVVKKERKKMQKFVLNQKEIHDLKKQNDLIRQQEQILLALRLQQQTYLGQFVFPRLGIPLEQSEGAEVSLDVGELVLHVKEDDTKEKTKTKSTKK